MEGHAMSEEGERSSMGIPRLASRFCRAQIDPSGHATWDSVPLSWGSESRRNGGRPVTYVEKFLYQTPSPRRRCRKVNGRSSTCWLGWWSQMRRKGLPTSRRSRAWWVLWLDSECGNQLQLSRDGGDLRALLRWLQVLQLWCQNGAGWEGVRTDKNGQGKMNLDSHRHWGPNMKPVEVEDRKKGQWEMNLASSPIQPPHLA